MVYLFMYCTRICALCMKRIRSITAQPHRPRCGRRGARAQATVGRKAMLEPPHQGHLSEKQFTGCLSSRCHTASSGPAAVSGRAECRRRAHWTDQETGAQRTKLIFQVGWLAFGVTAQIVPQELPPGRATCLPATNDGTRTGARTDAHGAWHRNPPWAVCPQRLPAQSWHQSVSQEGPPDPGPVSHYPSLRT